MSFILKFLDIIRAIIEPVARVLFALPRAISIAGQESYFPEKERKNYVSRLVDNIVWTFRFKEANSFYYLYGFDVKGKEKDAYMDYLSFAHQRDKTNRKTSPDSQITLLRDKFLFYQYLKAYNIPTPGVFGLIKNGVIYNSNLEKINVSNFADETDYFIKEISGECASFVKHVRDYSSLLETLNERKQIEGTYILQRRVEQHSIMAELNPNAVNTLRIVTINKNGEPYVLTSLLRVGTMKAKGVDNWAAGGLAIGINDDGSLKQYGFYKPSHGKKADVHPDTGIVFSSFNIPYFDEAKKMACEAHKKFYGIRSIGWDIAITPNGITFIEGNDNWEISLMQACDKPLRNAWKEAIK